MQENKLLENENLLKTTKTHKFCIDISKIFLTIFAIPMILFAFSIPLTLAHHNAIDGTITFGIICLFLLVPISNSIKRITQKTTITNKRVIINSGWINKTTTEIIPEKIESITVEQGLSGKMYGFGNVYIHGLGGTQDPIMYTSEPFELKQTIQNMIQTKSDSNNK